jgi:hypothetical protein
MLSRLEVAVPFYSSFKALYFTHLYWATTILPQECHAYFSFQISDGLFFFSLLQSLFVTTLTGNAANEKCVVQTLLTLCFVGIIVSRVYRNANEKSRFE